MKVSEQKSLKETIGQTDGFIYNANILFLLSIIFPLLLCFTNFACV